MSYTYTPTVPVPTNPPANDVLNMQNNSQAINSWVQTDHVGFNASSNSGIHNQVNFAATQASPTLKGTAVAEIWVKDGTADSSKAQLFYQNASLSFLISGIRAWGYGNTSGIISSQSGNVSTVSKTGTGTYTITLTSGAVASANFAALVTADLAQPGNHIGGACASNRGYSGGQGSFTLTTYDAVNGTPADNSSWSFAVIQL